MAFEIKKVKSKGRAVIAARSFRRNALVLRHEILPIPAKENIGAFLDNYVFFMERTCFICLGIGSLINHSAEPNLCFRLDKKKLQLSFYALSDIAKGEELTIDYEWDSYPWEQNT